MQFQPFLSQLTPDPTFDWKLPKALTLAAFGLSDSQLSRYRTQLSEGIHWFKDRHAGNKIWFTLAGLLELSALLNTDRARDFRSALLVFTHSNTALTHQPRGQAVHQPSSPTHLTSFQPEPLPLELAALQSNGINLNDLLQLKRDEIELRRSEQETRRLELMQQAYDRSTVLPSQSIATSLQARQPESPSSPLPPQVIIHNHNQVESGGWSWFPQDVFLCTLVMTFYLFIAATLVTALGTGVRMLTPEAPGHVQR